MVVNRKAYIKLLDKAHCTVNFCSLNLFLNEDAMALNDRVDYLLTRLKRFKAKGYSGEYVKQLVCENPRG